MARPLLWRRRCHKPIKGGVIAQCVAAQRIILRHATGLHLAPGHIPQPVPVQHAIDKAFRAQEHPYLALAVLGEGFNIAVRLLEMHGHQVRSEEHTSELQSLMRISYAVFCLKKKNKKQDYKCTTTQ